MPVSVYSFYGERETRTFVDFMQGDYQVINESFLLNLSIAFTIEGSVPSIIISNTTRASSTKSFSRSRTASRISLGIALDWVVLMEDLSD